MGCLFSFFEKPEKTEKNLTIDYIKEENNAQYFDNNNSDDLDEYSPPSYYHSIINNYD